jgi:hypothetical protein
MQSRPRLRLRESNDESSLSGIAERKQSRAKLKCLAFSDRIIKLNDYLLSQATMEHEKYKKRI